MPPNASPRILITAGPTHEPIDAVRYLANRSSGRLGIALAQAAAHRGCPTSLLLGPTPARPPATPVQTHRFQSTADLDSLLQAHAPDAQVVIMAAAVADYRPKQAAPGEKLRRLDAGLTLELEPTPDLLAGLGRHKPSGQILVGFALEPADRLLESARAKLVRKRLDFIVANPLITMDSPDIEATLLSANPEVSPQATGSPIPKSEFANWLLDRVLPVRTNP